MPSSQLRFRKTAPVTSWDVFAGLDLSAAASVTVKVAASGFQVPATPAGYTVGDAAYPLRQGNFQSATTLAETITFTREGPFTDDESLTLATAEAAVFTAILDIFPA